MKNREVKQMAGEKKRLWRMVLSGAASVIIVIALYGMDILPVSRALCAVFALILSFFCFRFALPPVKGQRAALFLLSFLFSLWSVLGRICNAFICDYSESVMREFFTLRSLFYLAALFALFTVLLSYFITRLAALDLSAKDGAKKPRLFFALSLFFMLLCILPVFLNYYPGMMTWDTRVQLEQITGLQPLSNHHPVFHTFLLSLPYRAGIAAGLDPTDSFALVCAVQAVFLAVIYSLVCTRLYRRGIKPAVCALCTAFYALMPVCVFYSITPWKDMPFAAVFVLFTLDIEELAGCEKPSATLLTRISVKALLMALLRNNAIYMVALCGIVFVCVLRNCRLKLAGAFAGVLAVFFIFNGPVLSLMGAASTESAEYLAIPTQQLGRMAAKGIEFDEEDTALLSKLITPEALAANYHPDASDYIKFSDDYHAEAFSENKAGYLKLWLKNVVRHPSAAVEGHLVSTLGYWYPEVRYSTIIKQLIDNDFGIERRSAQIGAVDSYYDYVVTNRSSSVTEPLITLGVWIWAACVFALLTYFRKGGRYLLVFMPALGVWLTLIAASPLYAGARYVYCILVSLPVYFCTAYLPEKIPKK